MNYKQFILQNISDYNMRYRQSFEIFYYERHVHIFEHIHSKYTHSF